MLIVPCVKQIDNTLTIKQKEKINTNQEHQELNFRK